MHEAALAHAVALAIRGHAGSGARIRLLVSGGHADVDAFDAALRFRLEAADPDIDLDAIVIEHVPEERPCLSCGRSFAAIGMSAECPHCGGIGLTRPRPEWIEIGWNGGALSPEAASTATRGAIEGDRQQQGAPPGGL